MAGNDPQRGNTTGNPQETLRSVTPGIVWPAIPGPRAATLMALLHQLEASQWWPAERLLDHQLCQLQVLTRYVYEKSQFWRTRWGEAGFDPAAPLTMDRLRQLPLLTRRDTRNAGESLFIHEAGSMHGPLGEVLTSGSTGQPVRAIKTSLTSLLWAALTLREHIWHRRDAGGKLAVIRAQMSSAAPPPEGVERPEWGVPISRVYRTGPFVGLHINTDVSIQATWLARHNPHYLLTYPSNLMALAIHFHKSGAVLPNLRHVQTVGETVSTSLREVCRAVWNVPVIDMYSSQEVGYMALQCPDCEMYHVQSESVLVEILDSDGNPCAPGEVGRVVVTDLHNFATPVVRYEVGDYAEVAPPCPCGRGLPTLARIVGRHRNMLTLPSGEQRWPLFEWMKLHTIVPIRQFQFIQLTREQIEVRLATDRPVRADEETALREVIQGAFGARFDISFVYLDEIPRSANGKFEEFSSKLATNPTP